MAFNSPEVLPSLEQIEHSFGATHPGVYDPEKEIFTLNFRGLSFYFQVTSKFQSGKFIAVFCEIIINNKVFNYGSV